MSSRTPVDDELTPQERERALEAIASRIRRYGMETPAIMFLEMHRPLSGLAGLASHAVTPFFGAFLGQAQVERYAGLISDKTAMDELIARLDPAAEPAPDKET
jgi:hypothetical protein